LEICQIEPTPLA